jgi:hypothetical protein
MKDNSAKNPIIVSLVIVIILITLIAWRAISANKGKEIGNFLDTQANEACINDYCLKLEDRWYIQNEGNRIPGDKAVIEKFLTELNSIKLDNLVSVNENNFNNFELSDNQMVVNVNGRRLEVGKISSEGNMTYIKVDNRVYKIDKVFDKKAMASTDFWKETRPFGVMEKEMVRVVKTRAKEIKTYEAKEGVWPELVSKVVQISGKLKEEKDPKGITKTAEWEFENKDGGKVKFEIGEYWKNRWERWWTVKDYQGNIYEISKFDFDLLTRG